MMWADGVKTLAGVPYSRLGDVLGDDGKWAGVWSRYKTGASCPSLDRVQRIDDIVRGTARIYNAPLWTLVEDRSFSKPELDYCLYWLPPHFRDQFIPDGQQCFGRRWEVFRADSPFFKIALDAAYVRKYALDAVIAILLCLRAAEWWEDSAGYFRAAKAWASLTDIRRGTNYVLLNAQALIPKILAPLRHRKFYPQEIDDMWRSHARAMNWGIGTDDDSDNENLAACLMQLRIQGHLTW